MKVLLIDDHPLILAALQSVIQGLGDGVTVSASDSGASARETLRQDASYDLVLLDLHLGDADGFDLLGELQRRDRRAAALRFHQVWVEQIVELVIPRDDRAGQPGDDQKRGHQQADVAVDQDEERAECAHDVLGR